MRRRLRLLPLLVLPLLFLSLAFAPPPRAPDAKPAVTVRLGTWNIEWLGNPAKRRKPAQKPEDIAKYLLASKVDLLGLNEISHNVEGGPPANRTLNEVFELMKKETGKEWKHLLFAKEDEAEKDLLCGVAWNTERVKLVGEPFRVPIRRPPQPDPNFWRRHPYAVKFSFGEGKTDVVLIPVHMKSNSGGGVTKMSKVRAEEARALVRALAAVQNHFRDDDVIVLGDCNCLLREEPALVTFRGAGLRDLNADDQLSWIRTTRFDPAPFDRILVPDDQPEFKECVFHVFREHSFNSEREFSERLSDHYLVYTDIKVLDDDD